MEQKVKSLADAVSQEAAALATSQQQIEQLRQQVAELQAQLTARPTPAGQSPQNEETLAHLSGEVEAIHEQQDIQKSELATHD